MATHHSQTVSGNKATTPTLYEALLHIGDSLMNELRQQKTSDSEFIAHRVNHR